MYAQMPTSSLGEMQIRASALDFAMRLSLSAKFESAEDLISAAEKILQWIKTEPKTASLVVIGGAPEPPAAA